MLDCTVTFSEASIDILLLFYELNKSIFANRIIYQSFFANILKIVGYFLYKIKKHCPTFYYVKIAQRRTTKIYAHLLTF